MNDVDKTIRFIRAFKEIKLPSRPSNEVMLGAYIIGREMNLVGKNLKDSLQTTILERCHATPDETIGSTSFAATARFIDMQTINTKIVNDMILAGIIPVEYVNKIYKDSSYYRIDPFYKVKK